MIFNVGPVARKYIFRHLYWKENNDSFQRAHFHIVDIIPGLG